MLLAISDKLSEENLKDLKFLCSEDIGKKKLEKINKGIDLFECLIEKAEIGPDNTERLRYLLNQIEQQVLLEIIDEYERGVTASTAGALDAKER
ncbi:hypothetical protein M9458_015052, partial [Cirrhinus mrigala]